MTVERLELTVAGIRSPVLVTGPQSDEAVVCVHGNPGSSEDWRPLAERVEAFARLVAPDMPGFGKAGRPRDHPYDSPSQARHLEDVLDQLGVRRVHLLLHDFGGSWGLRWALGRRDALASLTLVDVGVTRDHRWHGFARVWRTRVLGELFIHATNRTGFRLAMWALNPRGLPRPFVDRLYGDMDRDHRRAVLKAYRSTQPWEESERARVECMERSGHWPFVDDQERFMSLVVPWLREQVGAHAAVA